MQKLPAFWHGQLVMSGSPPNSAYLRMLSEQLRYRSRILQDQCDFLGRISWALRTNSDLWIKRSKRAMRGPVIRMIGYSRSKKQPGGFVLKSWDSVVALTATAGITKCHRIEAQSFPDRNFPSHQQKRDGQADRRPGIESDHSLRRHE
jgi:hypothetical protein